MASSVLTPQMHIGTVVPYLTLVSGLLTGPHVSTHAVETLPEASVVAPNSAVNAMANDVIAFAHDEARLVALYASSEFISSIPYGGFINRIAFRLDESMVPEDYAFDIGNVEIRMSTSASTVATLPSLRFVDLIGKDELVVFGAAAIHFHGTALKSGLNPFDLVVDLTHPFFYDPFRGSLAIDIQVTTGSAGVSPWFDGSTGKKAISLVGNKNLEQAFGAGPAPVVEFGVMPIPEPPMQVILLAGGLLLAFRAKFQ